LFEEGQITQETSWKAAKTQKEGISVAQHQARRSHQELLNPTTLFCCSPRRYLSSKHATEAHQAWSVEKGAKDEGYGIYTHTSLFEELQTPVPSQS
jgi:hypothetical protein